MVLINRKFYGRRGTRERNGSKYTGLEAQKLSDREKKSKLKVTHHYVESEKNLQK